MGMAAQPWCSQAVWSAFRSRSATEICSNNGYNAGLQTVTWPQDCRKAVPTAKPKPSLRRRLRPDLTPDPALDFGLIPRHTRAETGYLDGSSLTELRCKTDLTTLHCVSGPTPRVR